MAFKNLNESYYNDPEVRALQLDADHLLQYFILNPHSHFSGIYYLPMSAVPAESKLPVDKIQEIIDTLSGKPDTLSIGYQYPIDRVSDDCANRKHWFIYYDDRYQVMYVKSMLYHQTGGSMSARQIRSVLNHIVQFIKSPALTHFLAYHREYFDRCLAEMASKNKKDSERAREALLRTDLISFYAKVGLSFFSPETYPNRDLQQEEASEAESVEASAFSLTAHSALESCGERIFTYAEKLFKCPLPRTLPLRNVDYAIQQINVGHLILSKIETPHAYLRSAAAAPGSDYRPFPERNPHLFKPKEEAIAQ